MRVEIPKCLRCCFCIPLRHGVLVFGYLHLIFTLMLLSLEAYLDFGQPITIHTMTLYRGVDLWNQMWLTFVLYALEVVFNLVLIVGAHIKHMTLIRVYYYYGIMTTVAAFLAFIVVRFENRDTDYDQFICLTFSAFVVQIYLLFLIRSELQKARYEDGQHRYVNHMAEVVTEQPTTEDGRLCK